MPMPMTRTRTHGLDSSPPLCRFVDVDWQSEAKAETVFIITWDNSAGWKQRVVHYLAGLIPTREEAAVLYLAECRVRFAWTRNGHLV